MSDAHDEKAREILDDPRNFVKDPIAGPIPMHFNAFYGVFAQALRDAVAKERERCARVAEDVVRHNRTHKGGISAACCNVIAAAIRSGD